MSAGHAGAEGAPDGAARTAVRLKILVVEDEALIRVLLETVFADEGHEALVVANAAEAFAAVNASSCFDALVTDINLGQGPSGWEVARTVLRSNPHAVVVYVTGDSAHELAAMSVGPSRLVTKPFTPAEILAALGSLVGS